MINLRNITAANHPTNSELVVLSRPCPFCSKTHSVSLPADVIRAGIDRADMGECIQRAFPTLTADEREFFMTGICPTCWNDL